MLRDKSLIHKRGRCRKFGNHSLSGYCLTLNMPHVNRALGYFLVDSVNTAKGNGFIMICWIWFSFDDCLCHHMVLTNGIHKDERQTERKQTFFFSFALHALAIIILLYAKEASCVEPHCCGEKERKETGIMRWAQWSISVLCLLLPIPPSVDDRCSVMRLKHPRPAPSSCHQPN